MKNRGNQVLLAIFLASFFFYGWLLWESVVGSHYPHPLWLVRLQPYLLLGFHVVPIFSLQLLLCRLTKRRLVRMIPLLPTLALFGTGVLLFLRSTGWDQLGALILLIGSVAPATGCLLGRLAYHVTSRPENQKEGL